jgi:primary-amine oxidase
MYYKASPDDNEYAHPLDLCPVVDLCQRRVIHIDAYDAPPGVPMAPGNYHRALLDRPFRQAPKPLHITQPEVLCGVCVWGGGGEGGACVPPRA